MEVVNGTLHEIVAPSEHDRLKELSKYTAISIEHKKIKNKILNKKKFTKKKNFLSRNDMKKVGLYSLPRQDLKYKDYIPLNQLWNSYLKQQLGTKINGNMTQIEHPQYEAISTQLHKSDFHGAKIKVVRSKCSSVIGINGIVVLDTKNTFKVLGKDDILRTIPKSDSVFEIKWRKVIFTIFGKHIAFRPSERSVKKVKMVREMDL